MFASNGQYVSRQDYQQQQQQQAQQPDIQLRIDELVDESGQVIHGLQDLESQFTHSSTDVTSTFGRSSTDMTIDTTIAPFLEVVVAAITDSDIYVLRNDTTLYLVQGWILQELIIVVSVVQRIRTDE
ncbi:hypothetical protein NP233_g11604 [Leucocoprinus birnbaumii]|uniref:Uncharacterized protein n=1 Tax=Leucocoprinus birnbaumii TaxID=56174 RepID=A0AAD5YQT5_9AGAR|nr:hypothetical protein NP233_g11604 [Leucocoprinus birnbaumii]